MSTEQLLAQALQELQKLRTDFNELKTAIVTGKAVAKDGWVSTTDAVAALEPDGVMSRSHLQRLRLEGVLSERNGCTRNISKSDRPTWQYHLPSCRKALVVYFKKLG